MSNSKWKVLIVDDEPEVHTVTKLVMGQEEILGRGLEFLEALNGEEARKILIDNDDIALVLLDVVMSSDNDGLEVADWIRNDLNNHLVRIVLRTGNPGEAPEMQVITGYDINDYKEKSELTAKKLRTLFYTSLRSYRDLITLDQCRMGLVRVVSSLADMYIHPSLEDFTGGLLEQIASYLFLNKGAIYGISSGLSAIRDEEKESFHIVAATGDYADRKGMDLNEVLPDDIRELTRDCIEGTSMIRKGDLYIHCTRITDKGKALLVMLGVELLTPADMNLLNIFIENAGRAFGNLAARQNDLNRHNIHLTE